MKTRGADEQLLRRLADEYVSIEGAMLLEEMSALPERLPTPRMDARVLGIRRRRGYAWGAASVIAAAALILLLVTQLGRNIVSSPEPPPNEAQYEIIPLAFALPQEFSVEWTDYDNGKSVYHLAHAQGDDVTLTMELWSGPVTVEGGVAVSLGGKEALAVSRPEYSLLFIEGGGVLYSLSCRYDVNTLLPIGRNIL